MREHKRDKGRLEDIVKYAKNVELIVNGITFDDFSADIRIYYSVMKNIEVIGEASNMLTRDFRNTYTDIPWREVISMRNILVHGYSQVSDIDVWNAAINDVKPLRIQAETYINTINWEEWEQTPQEFSELDSTLYKKALETARKLKKMGLTTQQIMSATELTEEEIEKI